MTADEIVPWFRAAARSGALELPPPGLGSSGARFEALWELGRSDLSHARLGEAHADAVAILAEAGREPPPEQEGLAVWAAEGPASRVAAELDADTVHLRGVKRWCSGAGIVSHALITAHDGGRALLVLVPMGAPGVDVTDDGWAAPAFSATCTRRVEFEVTLPATAVVGPPGFYLDRPGFWYGAIGVAACWGGGAAGLVDAAERYWKSDAHAQAARGAAGAGVWAMRSALLTAAALIDGGGLHDAPERRQALALTVRHLVDHHATDVIGLVTRSVGPGPLAHDADFARRVAELQLYLRQSHAERDLEALGRLPRPTAPPW